MDYCPECKTQLDPLESTTCDLCGFVHCYSCAVILGAETICKACLREREKKD